MKRRINEWKIQIGSPQELAWEIQRFLENQGFTSSENLAQLKLEPTPIEGHATFTTSLRGKKRYSKVNQLLFIH